MADPNPQLYDVEREALPLEEAEDQKRTECRYYVCCMNKAIRLGWDQFTCKQCDVKAPRHDDIAEIEVPDPSPSMRTSGRAWSSGGRSLR